MIYFTMTSRIHENKNSSCFVEYSSMKFWYDYQLFRWYFKVTGLVEDL